MQLNYVTIIYLYSISTSTLITIYLQDNMSTENTSQSIKKDKIKVGDRTTERWRILYDFINRLFWFKIDFCIDFTSDKLHHILTLTMPLDLIMYFSVITLNYHNKIFRVSLKIISIFRKFFIYALNRYFSEVRAPLKRVRVLSWVYMK